MSAASQSPSVSALSRDTLATGRWAMEQDNDMSSFDILRALPTLDESRLLASEAVRSLPYSPLGARIASGTGGAIESALERADCDSDEELEAIRGSVRSLRAQRVAVEQLKEKARHDERTAEVLRRKLREAEDRIKELRAHGGRDVVRRLMDEVSELRSRLKATSGALQTREKSVAELREAVQDLEQDTRTANAKARAQSQKADEQERESRENLATIRRLEEACSRCEDRASAAEKRAEEKCAGSSQEVESLSSLLREAKAALGTAKSDLEATVDKHIRTLDAARKEKESLLFQKGQEKERIKELTSLCEQQRARLADSGQRLREAEKAVSTAKKESKLAGKQVAELKVGLIEANGRRKEEAAGATSKLRAIVERAEELKVELATAREGAAEKERQLVEHRDEMSTFRQDVNKLREVAAQQGEMRQALRERDETIESLQQRLGHERRERGQWARARKELLSQFCDEENKLRSTLQTERRQHPQPLQRAASVAANRYTKHDHSLRKPSSVHSSVGEHDSVNSLRRGLSDAREEKTGADIADAVLLGLSRRNRAGLDSNGTLSSDRSGARNNGIIVSDGSGVRGRANASDRTKRRGRRKSQNG